MIDPYIFAIGVIGIVLIMCAILVKRIYDNRTRSVDLDVEGLLESIIPKPPGG